MVAAVPLVTRLGAYAYPVRGAVAPRLAAEAAVS
jgi:hypothetical protein